MPCSAVLLLLLHADVAPLPPWAPGGASRGEDLVVSLATIGPGDGLAYMGGHSALAIVDKRLEQGRLYNFGVVDFSVDLMWNFVLGRLDFYADDASILATYDTYRALDRDLRVQVLNLTPEQALALANGLSTGVLPENRTYRYHHFDDNCATRPRDIIDRALGGALSRATSGPARMSLRDHARRYTRVFPLLSVWLDFMQNDSVDRPITQREEAFLPDELERQLDHLVLPSGPAVKQKSTLYVAKTNSPPPNETPRWTGWLALISVLVGAGVLVLNRRGRPAARKPLGVLLAGVGLWWGGSGTLLFLLSFFTEHAITHGNENLLFASPITLALLPLGAMLFKEHPWAASGLKLVMLTLAALAVLGVALKVLPKFDQQNWNIVALTVPFTLACALAWGPWRGGPKR